MAAQETEWWVEEEEPGLWTVMTTVNGREICVTGYVVDGPTAHLLAAAPKMREALEAIVEELADGDTVSAEQIARHAGAAALKAGRPS